MLNEIFEAVDINGYDKPLTETQAGKKNRNDQWKYLKCVYGYIACCHS